MAPNTGTSVSKVASKAAKKSKQADKAAKKEALAIKSKGKGKLEDEEEDLEAILERYQQELQAVCTPFLRFSPSYHPEQWMVL